MSVIRNWLASVLMVVFTQASICTCLNHEKIPNATTEIIATYVRLPWINGLNWLVDSAESPEREEVRAFFRGIESRDPRSLQILNTLLKDQPEIEERIIRDCDSYSQSNVAKYHNDIDIRDERCMVSVGTIPEWTTTDITRDDSSFCVSKSDLSSPNTDQYGRIADHVTQNSFTTAESLVIVLFLVLLLILLGCTVCDYVKRKKLGEASATVNTMAKFSLYTNALALLNTKSDAEAMPALQGIKCLCSFSVMFGHRYFATALLLNKKVYLLDFLKARNTLFCMYFMMSSFAVETFSVISGFLAAYVFLKLKQSGLKFNVLTMYLYRYLRLTPCVVVMLLFVSVFFHRCGSGPIWEYIIAYVIKPCEGNWWVNLFYVQNLIPQERICLTYTWYLAADMQLFILSPLILYPLHHFPKFGLRLLSFFLVVALVTPVIILVANDYFTSMLRFGRNFTEQLRNFGNFYISTHKQAFPYLIGIFLGYYVMTERRRLTQVNVMVNWIVAALLMLLCAWLHSCAHNFAFTDDWHVRIASAVLSTPVWSIAMAWVIYACTQGYGGLITRFFSLPIFLPLSRISYCVYMVHMAIEAITISASQSPGTILGSNMFNGIWGNLVLSVAVAFVFTLFIERPTIVLSKILMAHRVRKPGYETNNRISM